MESGKESKRHKIEESESIETLFGMEMRLNQFKQTSNIELDRELYWQCFKLSTKNENENGDVTLSNFKVTLTFQLASDITEIYGAPRVNVWITSEENSFGLATERWFDESVQPSS